MIKYEQNVTSIGEAIGLTLNNLTIVYVTAAITSLLDADLKPKINNNIDMLKELFLSDEPINFTQCQLGQ